jgi:hypothetical protein
LRATKISIFLLSTAGLISAVAKTHVITFGRWTTARLFSGANEDQPLDIKIRALSVDAIVKAYTFGVPHEITDRVFVVERVLRVNDSLPSEKTATPRWIWQRGGWIAVDRGNGHISSASLAEFDPDFSVANWYRDYAAYCGVSQDGKKLYAIVMQLGRRKPILRKPIADMENGGAPECAEPDWQRQPTRVTFAWRPDQKITYSVRGSAVEISDDDQEGTD